VYSHLYARKNVRKLREEMWKRLFSKGAVPKVGDNSIFFLVLLIKIGIMRLEDAETLVTQNYNVSSSWCELCRKRKNLEKFRRWKFWNLKAIVSSSKIIGLYLKNYFDEKNKISKKSKFKSQSRRFFKKRDQKIENLDKKFCQTSIPKFFFLIKADIW